MKLRILLTLDLLNVFGFAFWGPLFTVYAIKLGASPSLAGGLYGFYTLIHAGAFFVFGHLDKPNRRLSFVVGGYLTQALMAIFFVIASSPWFLILPLFFSAMAGGMISPSWKVLFTKAMKEGKEGRSWSYYDTGEAVVISFGALGAGLIAGQFGYKAMFWPLMALNLVAVFLAFQNRSAFRVD